jgi:hypothetical protein
MRYRVFQNEQFLGAFSDRSAFEKAYSGENPNSPTRGDKILLDEKMYVVKWYTEHDSESFTENEFHQKENDWFADIIVK